MNKFFDLIDKYKFGVLSVCMVCTGVFVYLQLTTYSSYTEIQAFNVDSTVEVLPEEIVLTQDNLEIPPPDFSTGKVTNTARDMGDKREQSEEDWSGSKSAKETEQSVKDEERRMFEETGGAAKRKAIQEEDAERKKNKKDQSTTTTNKSNETSNSGGDKAVKGNVMVEWTLPNRSPHQNNEWNVRNPGYTCGTGSSGRVVVAIKVGQDGKVISALYDPVGSTSASPCMVEQAIKYAKKSRFDYSAGEVSQSGKIFYTFVSQ
jgi:outer membrane biosynthesis protein TonB